MMRLTVTQGAMIAAVFILGVLHAAAKDGSEKTYPTGLYVEKGVLYRQGKPYRALGVNYASLFDRPFTVDDPKRSDCSDYKKKLRELALYDIPFVRSGTACFWPSEWKTKYVADKNRYFTLMDEVVRELEKDSIGVIVSLFWTWFAVPDLLGEHMDALDDPSSRTRAFMRDYVREVVTRYKDSPAIWGWEIGNEYLNMADIPALPPIAKDVGTPEKRDPVRDAISSGSMMRLFTYVAEEIRKYDKHRIITTGNAIGRTSSYNNRNGNLWKQDTKKEWLLSLIEENPSPIDTVGLHIYDVFPDKAKNFNYFSDEKIDTFGQMLRIVNDAATIHHKPLFLGEFYLAFGDHYKGMVARGEWKKIDEEFKVMIDEIIDAKVPIACAWTYDICFPQGHGNRTNVWYPNAFKGGRYEFILSRLHEGNERIRKEMR